MIKSQPVKIDPNKDISEDQKQEDLSTLEKSKKVKDSSTSGDPERQEESLTKEINPFRND